MRFWVDFSTQNPDPPWYSFLPPPVPSLSVDAVGCGQGRGHASWPRLHCWGATLLGRLRSGSPPGGRGEEFKVKRGRKWRKKEEKDGFLRSQEGKIEGAFRVFTIVFFSRFWRRRRDELFLLRIYLHPVLRLCHFTSLSLLKNTQVSHTLIKSILVLDRSSPCTPTTRLTKDEFYIIVFILNFLFLLYLIGNGIIYH